MRRVVKNLLALTLSDVGRRVMGFLTIAYLARVIGAAGFGAINIGFTALSYGLILATAGLSALGTREVAQGAGPETAARVMGIRLLLATAAFILLVTIGLVLIPNTLTGSLVALFAASLFPNALLLDWFFLGKEEMGKVSIARACAAAVYLAGVFVMVHSEADLLWVAVAAVVSDATAMTILLAAFYRRYRTLRVRFHLQEMKSLLQRSLPLGAGSVFALLSVNLPPIVLGIILSNYDVGIFSAAGKLVFFLLMFDRVLGTLLLPASSRLQSASPEVLAAHFQTALKWSILIAAPLTVGGMMLAPKLLPFIFGPEFTGAVPAFRILIWYFFFTMLHTIFTTGVIAAGKERAYSVVMMISAGIYLVTIVAGTFAYGVIGAAAGVVLSEAATLVLMRRQFRRFTTMRLPSSIFGVIAATIGMALVLSFLPADTHVIPAILFGGVTYIAALFATGALTRMEIVGMAERV